MTITSAVRGILRDGISTHLEAMRFIDRNRN
ncbi:MAG: hypothetical protein QGI41_02535 [Acidimicrobiales bacterium]|nr:hypothetical protein [Acidimicrobiales bacterium]HJO99149.1 hypothetical protein [Acidimicrobiales bacterium]